MTLFDQYKAALLARGETVVKHGKYLVMTNGTTGLYYYLGRAGALRVGRTVKGSVPVSTQAKARLIDSFNLDVKDLF